MNDDARIITPELGTPDVYRHFKGGLYRVLFVAPTVSGPYVFGHNLKIACTIPAMHSEDGRKVNVLLWDPRLVLEGSPIMDGVQLPIVLDPAVLMTENRSDPHVVYVSLKYGTVWVRPYFEFFGNIAAREGTNVTVRRFAPFEVES